MTDFYQKIVDMQGGLEDVARKIPGFAGYLNKQDRRAADSLLREQLVSAFESELASFNRLQQRMLDSSGLTHMERTQAIDGQMRTFIDRIKAAAQGYGGLFDAVKVDESALERVYAFDNALFTYREQFVSGIQQVESALGGDAVADILRQLESIVVDANEIFKKRSDALMGLDQ